MNINYFHFCCSLRISVDGGKKNLIWINRRCEKELLIKIFVCWGVSVCLELCFCSAFKVGALWRWPISKKHSSALHGELGSRVSWKHFACGYCDQRHQNTSKPIFFLCSQAAFRRLPWASCNHVMTFSAAYELWMGRNMTKGRKCINYRKRDAARNAVQVGESNHSVYWRTNLVSACVHLWIHVKILERKAVMLRVEMGWGGGREFDSRTALAR